MAAMFSWTNDKSKELPDYLAESGLLSAEDRRWLNEAVDRQLQKRGHDAGRTLHDLGEVESVRQELRRIARERHGGDDGRPAAARTAATRRSLRRIRCSTRRLPIWATRR